MFFMFQWRLCEFTCPSLAYVIKKQVAAARWRRVVFQEPSKKVKILSLLLYELCTLLMYSIDNPLRGTDFFPF